MSWHKTGCALCSQNCGLEVQVENNRIVKPIFYSCIRRIAIFPMISRGECCVFKYMVPRYEKLDLTILRQ